jgi:hypothetical protein
MCPDARCRTILLLGYRAGLGGLSIYLHMYVFTGQAKTDNNLDLHVYFGFFVGLLLVFRTNISYGERANPPVFRDTVRGCMTGDQVTCS